MTGDATRSVFMDQPTAPQKTGPAPLRRKASLMRFREGGIGKPPLLPPVGLKVPVEDIVGDNRPFSIVLGRSSAPRPRSQRFDLHQSFDPVKPACKALFKDIAPDAAGAIDAVAGVEARLDCRDELGVYIDAETNDYRAVLRQISACDAILSSGLHGMVVADPYGIPNQWTDPFAISDRGRMKFYDYALVIDRLLPEPVRPDAAGEAIDMIMRSGLPGIHYMYSVNRAKAALKTVFPH